MRLPALAALLALTGCAGGGTGYQCEDGRAAVARFHAPDNLTLVLDGRPSELTRVRAASGARYADASTVFWIRSADAMLETPGTMTRCTLVKR